MFTTPCFVRSVSEKLMNGLNDLGYADLYTNTIGTQEVKTITVTTENGGWFLTGFAPNNKLYYSDNKEKYIDCGNNVELFLALAALRDDSDYMQWFVCPKTCTKSLAGYFGQVIGMDSHYEEIVGYEWYRHENKDNALTKRINEIMQIEGEDTEFLPHKATVEELIEHFNNG